MVLRGIRIAEAGVRFSLGPPNDNFRQRSADLVRKLGLIWQFQILFRVYMGFPRGIPVSGTSAVGLAQDQTTVGRGRL